MSLLAPFIRTFLPRVARELATPAPLPVPVPARPQPAEIVTVTSWDGETCVLNAVRVVPAYTPATVEAARVSGADMNDVTNGAWSDLFVEIGY